MGTCAGFLVIVGIVVTQYDCRKLLRPGRSDDLPNGVETLPAQKLKIEKPSREKGTSGLLPVLQVTDAVLL